MTKEFYLTTFNITEEYLNKTVSVCFGNNRKFEYLTENNHRVLKDYLSKLPKNNLETKVEYIDFVDAAKKLELTIGSLKQYVRRGMVNSIGYSRIEIGEFNRFLEKRKFELNHHKCSGCDKEFRGNKLHKETMLCEKCMTLKYRQGYDIEEPKRIKQEKGLKTNKKLTFEYTDSNQQDNSEFETSVDINIEESKVKDTHIEYKDGVLSLKDNDGMVFNSINTKDLKDSRFLTDEEIDELLDTTNDFMEDTNQKYFLTDNEIKELENVVLNSFDYIVTFKDKNNNSCIQEYINISQDNLLEEVNKFCNINDGIYDLCVYKKDFKIEIKKVIKLEVIK